MNSARGAVRYGYITHYMPKMERIRTRDKQLWGKITGDQKHQLESLLPPPQKRFLPQREHSFILPDVKSERFKRMRCFINRCIFNFICSLDF